MTREADEFSEVVRFLENFEFHPTADCVRDAIKLYQEVQNFYPFSSTTLERLRKYEIDFVTKLIETWQSLPEKPDDLEYVGEDFDFVLVSLQPKPVRPNHPYMMYVMKSLF